MEEKVKENKVCVTGFTLNEYLFMLPALRSMMGRISVEYVADLKQLKAGDYECDVICINCAINFYELELYFIFLEQKYGNSRPKVMCLATQDVPSESVEIMMKQCWIDGDMEFQTDDTYFFAAVPVLEALGETKEAEIKKL